MSLTRKLLKELELTDAAIERIIAAHVDTVDALRQERDEARAAASDRDDLAAQRDALRQEAEEHRSKLTTGLSYLQKIVFPNYDYMMLSYPWMTGAPRASLPLLWVYRIAHRGWTSRTKIPHVFLALKRFRRGEGRNQ